MKRALALLFSFLPAGSAADQPPIWQELLRFSVCSNQASFLQSKQELVTEAKARLQRVLAQEKVRTLSELAQKSKLRFHSRGQLLRTYLMAVAGEDAELSVEISMAITSVCSRIRARDLGYDNCAQSKALLESPQAVRRELAAQIKFLKDHAKITGRNVERSIDGGSLNVLDVRTSEVMRVGYGFWELLRTGKLCLNPSGCEYVIGPPNDAEPLTATQPEHEVIPEPACLARQIDMPSTNEFKSLLGEPAPGAE